MLQMREFKSKILWNF